MKNSRTKKIVLTIGPETKKHVSLLAKRDGVSLTKKATELVRFALEMEGYLLSTSVIDKYTGR